MNKKFIYFMIACLLVVSFSKDCFSMGNDNEKINAKKIEELKSLSNQYLSFFQEKKYAYAFGMVHSNQNMFDRDKVIAVYNELGEIKKTNFISIEKNLNTHCSVELVLVYEIVYEDYSLKKKFYFSENDHFSICKVKDLFTDKKIIEIFENIYMK